MKAPSWLALQASIMCACVHPHAYLHVCRYTQALISLTGNLRATDSPPVALSTASFLGKLEAMGILPNGFCGLQLKL